MKIHFREKHLRKKGIEMLTAELEEEMLEEHEFEYSSMNIRDGGKNVWILCNNADERANIREFLLAKDTVLVVEAERGKRFFAKFASKVEKDKWREEYKDSSILKGPVEQRSDLWINLIYNSW